MQTRGRSIRPRPGRICTGGYYADADYHPFVIQRAVAPTGSGSRLRVLIVGAWFPYPPRWGWATRVYQLARHLATMHDVTLLAYATAEDEPNVAELAQEFDVETVTREPRSRGARRLNQFASLLSDVPNEPYATRSREMQHAIDRLGQTRTFDVVQLESTLVWPF